MNNSVDKFFNYKLSDHAIEPGPAAWSRIRANLPKKNRTIIWFRAAAAIASVGLALLLWFNSYKTTTTNETVAHSIQQPVKEKVATNDLQNKPIENESIVAPVKIEKQKTGLASKTKSEPTVVKETGSSEQIEDILVEVAMIEPIKIDNELLQKEIQMKLEKEKPIVIVYELKQVAKKTESHLDLNLESEKKTGIKKVLEIANDVRTGDSPLGSLRQAKEEIFAFNFKKEDRNNK